MSLRPYGCSTWSRSQSRDRLRGDCLYAFASLGVDRVMSGRLCLDEYRAVNIGAEHRAATLGVKVKGLGLRVAIRVVPAGADDDGFRTKPCKRSSYISLT